MRYKIYFQFKLNDYLRIKEVLSENPSTSLELSPPEEFDFVKICPLVIATEGFGYSISSVVLFEQPIGFDVFNKLKIDAEKMSYLLVNHRNIKISKIVIDESQLENDLRICSSLIERIVNQVFNMYNKLIEKTLVINSESLDKKLDLIMRTKELEKRAEVPKPFGTIHAQGRKDAKERAGPDLIPIYLEKDKAYLYEDKKAFLLLPYNFVIQLLKIDGPIMVSSDHFTCKENEVLRLFCMRKYVKKMEMRKKLYYHSLDKKTRKILLVGLKNL